MAPIGSIAPIGLLPVGLGGASAVVPAQAAARAEAVTTPSADAFAGMLSRAVTSLNTQLVEANKLEQAAAAGELADPTEAIVAVQKADITLQMATQVRNKLVEGWQELSRMSV